MLGNVVASGTAIIDQLGPAHMRTARPIVYTSADSVFQIAAHEAVVPVPTLYEWCHVAYEIAVQGAGLGRVHRAAVRGRPGSFRRTANRHDYAMPPISETLLDVLTANGHLVTAIGKINDLFAGRGHRAGGFDDERRPWHGRAAAIASAIQDSGCCSSISSTSTRSTGTVTT